MEIVCTNGTIGLERLENLIEAYHMDHRDVYILVDEDNAGKKVKETIIERTTACCAYLC